MLGGPNREVRISSIYRWAIPGATAPSLKELAERRKARKAKEREVFARNMARAEILKKRIRLEF